jgi:hypothetical protein
MEWRTVTKWVIVLAPVLIAFYDLIAYQAAGNDATISKVCLDTARGNPLFLIMFVFALGVLCGHLFAGQHTIVYIPK